MTWFDRLLKWALITAWPAQCATFLLALWIAYHEDPEKFFIAIAVGVVCAHASLLYITAAMVYDMHQKVHRLEGDRCDE